MGLAVSCVVLQFRVIFSVVATSSFQSIVYLVRTIPKTRITTASMMSAQQPYLHSALSHLITNIRRDCDSNDFRSFRKLSRPVNNFADVPAAQPPCRLATGDKAQFMITFDKDQWCRLSCCPIFGEGSEFDKGRILRSYGHSGMHMCRLIPVSRISELLYSNITLIRIAGAVMS